MPDAVVRGFLLQNLRRDPSSDTGWRWQMNLALLGAELAEIGDWPDLHTPPYDGPVLWLAGANSDYITPAYAPAMRALFPRRPLVTRQERRALGAHRPAGGLRGGAAALPGPRLSLALDRLHPRPSASGKG